MKITNILQLIVQNIRTFFAAFSMYSRLPVPRLKWKDEDYENVICYLPFIGLTIGLFEVAWYYIAFLFGIPAFSEFLLAAAIPLLVTGGFHVDGYADVCDGLSSMADTEKKLQILHDPHIGAFAVIGMVKTGILYAAALFMVYWKISITNVILFALIFVLARAMAAASSVQLPHAQNKGMLSLETKRAGKGTFVVTTLEALTVATVMVFLHPIKGLLICAMALISLLYYIKITKKHFGGVTGDTAGYLVVFCETAMTIALAIGTFF